MASASSGRYQSRLFNFVHKQSRRLTQQCDRAFRQLQVATSAVVPILLYPIYLLFQSSSAAKLDHSVQQSWPQLPVDNTASHPETPTADTPIQRVLQAINVPSESAILTPQSKKPENFLAFLSFWRFKFLPNNLKSTSNLDYPSPTLKRLNIQGVATQLSSRTLVLVTTRNEILDIFTPQQQQKLQERIMGEVAGYWRYQQLSRQRLTKRLVPTRAKLLFPVSLSSIIAWVQTGTVALANNISQKSSLVSRQEVNLPQSEGTYPHPLVFLDRTVAALESKHLAAVSIALIDTAHSSKIKTLILAAINYFFGARQRQPTVVITPINASPKLPTEAAPAKSLPYHRNFNLPSAFQSFSTDVHWLTLNDLFGEPELVGESANLYKSELLTQTTSQLAGKNLAPYSNQVAKYSLQNLLNRLQTLLQPKQTSERVLQQKTSQGKGLREVGSKQLSPLPAGVNRGEANRYRRSNTNIEPQPDWIETNATALGYVLHPLEQLLAWLDRLMLWLEKILIKVLQQVQQLWRGK
jgi:hypothetical protein